MLTSTHSWVLTKTWYSSVKFKFNYGSWNFDSAILLVQKGLTLCWLLCWITSFFILYQVFLFCTKKTSIKERVSKPTKSLKKMRKKHPTSKFCQPKNIYGVLQTFEIIIIPLKTRFKWTMLNFPQIKRVFSSISSECVNEYALKTPWNTFFSLKTCTSYSKLQFHFLRISTKIDLEVQ